MYAYKIIVFKFTFKWYKTFMYMDAIKCIENDQNTGIMQSIVKMKTKK